MNTGRTYTVMNWSDLTDAIASKLDIDEKDELRRSTSGTDRVIVSWTGNAPNGLGSYTKYTHAQIKTLLEGSDWDIYQSPDSI